jgi:hypothetical protein
VRLEGLGQLKNPVTSSDFFILSAVFGKNKKIDPNVLQSSNAVYTSARRLLLVFSLLRLFFDPEDERSKSLRNIGGLLRIE